MDLFFEFVITVATMYVLMRLGASFYSVPQNEIETAFDHENESVMLGYITQEKNVFYVWNYATDEFLGQGRTKHELESQLRSNLNELYQQLKIIDKDNGSTLQAYRELDQ